ncbi:SAM-dependent methyltransferase [Streptomyces sp. NPDC058045]|uniref:SAM-dependent methyltransferase n=1 Tax=Streptomyces sp. NPDC058045 TaxID=3346311 RepID=UPI0036EE72EF
MTAELPRIDTTKPHPARVYDYLLGGKDHYDADKEVGANLPPIAAPAARLNRAFMQRAAAWCARGGTDQFLDIGTGIPTEPNLHQVVQAIQPAARVVYTDNDPVVLRHAEALMFSTREGATDYIQSDVREPEQILRHARQFLDFDRPVTLSLIALMHFVTDEWDPYGLVRTLVGELPSGSHLVMSHATWDFTPEIAEDFTRVYTASGMPLAIRDKAGVERFFDGLELLDPGVVPIASWYKDGEAPEPVRNMLYAGVARIP